MYGVKASDQVMTLRLHLHSVLFSFNHSSLRKRVITLDNSVEDLTPGDSPCAMRKVESELLHCAHPYSSENRIPKPRPGNPTRHPVARTEEDWHCHWQDCHRIHQSHKAGHRESSRNSVATAGMLNPRVWIGPCKRAAPKAVCASGSGVPVVVPRTCTPGTLDGYGTLVQVVCGIPSGCRLCWLRWVGCC